MLQHMTLFFTFDMYVSKLLGAVNEASKTSLAKELFSWLIWIIFEILWIIFNLKFLRLVLKKMRLNIIDWQRTVKVIKKREKHILHVQRRFLWSYLYNLVLFYFIHVPMFRSCVLFLLPRNAQSNINSVKLIVIKNSVSIIFSLPYILSSWLL